MRIILIEDSEVDASIFMRFAANHGHDVIWSESAGGAYDTLTSGKFDAAVVDFKLTDSVGEEVATFVRCWVHGKVCFLSGEALLLSARFPAFSKAGLSDDEHPIWKWLHA